MIFYSSEGIRVPKEALRVSKDGERGVYVVVSQKARFRPVKILAEDENSYLVKADPTDEEDTRILRAGDEIVLALRGTIRWKGGTLNHDRDQEL